MKSIKNLEKNFDLRLREQSLNFKDSSNADILGGICSKKEVNEYDRDGNTRLLAAISRQDITLVNELIKKGASLTRPPKIKYASKLASATPLELACSKANFAIIKMLISHGVNINAQNKSGTTALHRAAWVGNNKLVTFLLEKGADFTVVDNDNYTPAETARLAMEFSTEKLINTHIKHLDSKAENEALLTTISLDKNMSEKCEISTSSKRLRL